MMACGRASLGRRLLDRLCSSYYFSNNTISLIHIGGWRLWNCGLDKQSFGCRSYLRSRGNIPESSFVRWALLD